MSMYTLDPGKDKTGRVKAFLAGKRVRHGDKAVTVELRDIEVNSLRRKVTEGSVTEKTGKTTASGDDKGDKKSNPALK